MTTLDTLLELTQYHKERCSIYRDYVETLFDSVEIEKLDDLPFLPVRAFKEFEIKSVVNDEIYKIMRSSGTSGRHSQIFLDKETAKLQTRALVDSFKYNFGGNRFPMLIIDSQTTVKHRQKFSARTAAINGFSMFSTERCFALNDDMQLDLGRVQEFLKKNKDKKIFVFGFTFLIWQAFIEKLKTLNTEVNLQNAFILHGGGWKKLEFLKISNAFLKEEINKVTGCEAVHNYYGMVEQTGSIFIECRFGRLHASKTSDALVRDFYSHERVPNGSTGLIQVFSTIQKSYPGHSLLTEDIGRSFDGSTCPCGCPRTVLEIDGRLDKAEVRGCSDAYS